MSKIIGAARDFYRLRITRVDETDEPDLEWRDDILYRTPPVQRLDVHEGWVVEAITLDADEAVTRLGVYPDPDEAHTALDTATEALEELTKSQFEDRYFGSAPEST